MCQGWGGLVHSSIHWSLSHLFIHSGFSSLTSFSIDSLIHLSIHLLPLSHSSFHSFIQSVPLFCVSPFCDHWEPHGKLRRGGGPTAHVSDGSLCPSGPYCLQWYCNVFVACGPCLPWILSAVSSWQGRVGTCSVASVFFSQLASGNESYCSFSPQIHGYTE